MGSELLLYGYGIICLSMIVFNLIYGLVMRGNEERINQQSQQFEEAMNDQLSRIEQRESLDSQHIKFLQRKLSRVRNLKAFDQLLERCSKENETVQAYLAQIQPVILHLAAIYQKRENLQAAYFAYFLNQHKLNQYMQLDAVQDILVDYMKKDSLYCRVNALKALCSFGHPDYILQAVTIQDRSNTFLHEKILTESLLIYDGDSDPLIQRFLEQLEQFSVRIQKGILDYIRFKTGNYQKELFRILIDTKQDRELHFSAIRYFGRYPYPPARNYLLNFLHNTNPEDWEYTAISAAALANYSGNDVVEALVEAMHSSNWHIRYNAATSLKAHGLNYSDLIELVGGQDRYAREMILYQLESRRLEILKQPAHAEENTINNERNESI